MSIKFEIPSNVDSFTTVDHTVTGIFTLDGYVINPAGATTNQVLKYNGSSFVPANESGGGSMAIGSPVTSGTAKSVLFVDASGNLAQNNSNLFFNYSTLQLQVYQLDSISGSDPLRLGTTTASAVNIGHSAINTSIDGYVYIDGYQIDPTGATSGQVLAYNGTKFVASSSSGATLSSSYNTSGTSGNTITLTSAGGGVKIKDNNNPIGAALFSIGDNTSNIFFEVQSNGQSTFSSTGNGSLRYLVLKDQAATRSTFSSYSGQYSPALLIQGVTSSGAPSASDHTLFISCLADTTNSVIKATKAFDIYAGSASNPGLSISSSGEATIGMSGGTGVVFPTLMLGNNNYGPPTFSTRSTGTKYVTYNSLNGSNTDYAIGVESNDMWYSVQSNDGSRGHKWYGGTSAIMRLVGDGQLQLTPVAQTGSSAGAALKLTGAAHTALTASTEVNDGYFGLARTVQFSSSAPTIQRAIRIDAPTYSSTGSTTMTTAATLAVSNAPQAGTNMTITNAYSIWAQNGVAAFDDHIKVDGYTIDISAGATSGQALAYNGTKFIATTVSGGSGMSIGGPVASGTSKSVLYVDGSSNLAQDNSNFAWDFTNHRLGIGTNSPDYQLDIRNSSNTTQVHIRSNATTDDGMYLTSELATEAIVSGGAAFNGTNWIAKATQSNIASLNTARALWFLDTSLTSGNSFSPTQRMSLTTTGLSIGYTSDPSYLVDIRNSANSSLVHIRSNGTGDDGLYINAENGGYTLAGGAARISGSWTAKYTTAHLLDIDATANTFDMYSNTGLTIGNTFTPTKIASISSTLINIAGRDIKPNFVTPSDGYVLTWSASNSAYIPQAAGSGSIGGSIANTQVAYGSGTNTIQGSSGFTFDGTQLTAPVFAHTPGGSNRFDVSGANNNMYLGTVNAEQIIMGGGAYTDGVIIYTFLDLQGNAINNVTDPSVPQDAATKNYVDTTIKITEVANASSTQVTGTSATDIVSFTPTAQGNFQVNTYYRVVTATSNITMIVTWTDDTGAQTQTLVATATSTPVGSYVLQPIYINATTGSAIKVRATTGTANNLYVSASIIGIT